jgi:hypothetical protein
MKQKEKNQLDLELRRHIIEVADHVIDEISDSGMIITAIKEYWNEELDIDEAVEMAEKVYQQIKLRM